MSQIHVRFNGQFGNQLFCYCFGKVVAEITGVAYTPVGRFVDKKGRPIQWSNQPFFSMRPSPQKASSQSKKIKTFRCENKFDFQQLRGCSDASFIYGYYQRYEYYKPYKDKIRNEWLKLLVPFVKTDDSAIYLHLRRTDYVGVKNTRAACKAMTLDEYRRGLEFFPECNKVVIATDCPGDGFIEQIRSVGIPIEVSHGKWDEDFLMLASCKNLLMSQSTYSWWAGFLGIAEKIVCPLFQDTLWRYGHDESKDYPNLIVDDESRWHWITEDGVLK